MKTELLTIGAMLIAGITVGQVTANAAPTSNPFEQGTQAPVLNQEERASLLEYANNSKAKLEQALEDAKGLPFSQIQEIYREAIVKVVIESAVSKPRSELLMRYALNQALELTYGIPTADGKGIAQAGVLKDSANQNLLVEIVEDSIQLALNYYEDDRRAIQSGKLLDLPYAKLAQERLEMARTKWLPAVLEWGFQYNFSIAILKQFLTTIASEEQQHKAVYAEEIIKADSWLRFENQKWPKTWEELHKRVRVLRKNLKSLVKSFTQKELPQGARGVTRYSNEYYKNMTLEASVNTLLPQRGMFLPDGKRFMTYQSDDSTRIYDLKGNLLARYGSFREPGVSPDGLIMAMSTKTGSNSYGVALFDLEGEELASWVVPHERDTLNLSFSPDGSLIVGIGKQDKAYLWDLTGKLLATLPGHEYGVPRATFSPDGKKILTISGRRVRAWDLKGNKLLTISGHDRDIVSAEFSPDGTMVLTRSNNEPLKLWDMNGNLVRSFNEQAFAAFTPDGTRIVTGGSRLVFRDLSGNEVARLPSDGVFYDSIAFSSDGARMLLFSMSGIQVWGPGKRK